MAFLRPQIELVNPKVVATLGFKAYRAVLSAYGFFQNREWKTQCRK